MNLKKSLATIIALGMLFTGCNLSKEEEKTVADKATQQKTMTKVQNDVNEIMNKDYDYVLKNMGIPYCTTYYIDTESLEKLDIININELNHFTNIRLIYPKYTSDNQLGTSAIYIELNNNKVVEVQTNEFSKYDIKEDEVMPSTDLIIDMYDYNSSIPLNSMKYKDFTKYIGKSLDKIESLVSIEDDNFEVYDTNRKKMVLGYLLKDEDGNINKLLTVVESENIIRDIRVISTSDSIDLVIKNLME
ncbi:MAG: hypothetical protein RRZ84_03245 [Romboutsia sp.]